MKSNVILVGNGSTLLKKENGSLIDTYEHVVRFNAFDVNGYEKYVGTKSTIWFNVINFVDKNKQWRMQHQWDKIYLHSWQWDKMKDQLYIDFINFYTDNNKDISNIIKTTRNIITEISEFAGDSQYLAFSTGLIAIWELLKTNKTIDITGFDWWETETHHYNDAAVRGTLHKPQKEKIIIDKLMTENKLKFL